MKRILACVLAALLALSLIVGAMAEASADNAEFTYAFDDVAGTLAVHGVGPMPDYSAGAPWEALKPSIRRVLLGKGITSVSKGAFTNCANLESVSFPDSLEYIDPEAFTGSNNITVIETAGEIQSLVNVVISSNVTELMTTGPVGQSQEAAIEAAIETIFSALERQPETEEAPAANNDDDDDDDDDDGDDDDGDYWPYIPPIDEPVAAPSGDIVYDDQGRIIQETHYHEDGSFTETTYEYEEDGSYLKTTESRDSRKAEWLDEYYDYVNGHLVKTNDYRFTTYLADGVEVEIETDYEYDDQGREIGISDSAWTSDKDETLETYFTYEYTDKDVKRVKTQGSKTRQADDTVIESRDLTYEYNSDGSCAVTIVSTEDGVKKTSVENYDADGNRIEESPRLSPSLDVIYLD